MKETTKPAGERLASLDVFRGLTIAGMILVNNAGDDEHVFSQLDHAAWHGWTATDLIFPFFLFIVGVAITLAFRNRGEGTPLVRPVLRRAAILFVLGLLLNAFPFHFPEGRERPLRILGILQRIALCYTAAAFLAARTKPRTQALVAGLLLVGYGLALRFVNVPDFGPFDLRKGHDVGSWVDRLLLPGHLHQSRPGPSMSDPMDTKPWTWFDPEGLFSTIPAVATTLAGVLAGRWIADWSRFPHERASGLFFAGLAGTLAGLASDALVPINKQLWTPSYVLLTAGLGCQALAACYWLVDLQGVKRWAAPFLAFGRNPIVAFWVSHAVARILLFGITWREGEGAERRIVCAKQWLYAHVFASGGSSEWTSVAYAATYVAIWWAIMAVLDRKKIYVKI